MNREQAWQLVQDRVANKNLRKHMLATEACLRALARRLGGDEEQWGFAGLVHDLDYEATGDDPARHGLVAAEQLEQLGVAPEVTNAVKAHAGNAPAESLLDKAICAVDPLTGLIVAAALMHPTRKLAGLDTEFVRRRFAEKRFAAGADRDQIAGCAGFGIELDDFITVCLDAMKGIAPDLGF